MPAQPLPLADYLANPLAVAIRNMALNTQFFRADPQWIRDRLIARHSSGEVREALDTLGRLNMLPGGEQTRATGADVPKPLRPSAKVFHRAMWGLAVQHPPMFVRYVGGKLDSEARAACFGDMNRLFSQLQGTEQLNKPGGRLYQLLAAAMPGSKRTQPLGAYKDAIVQVDNPKRDERNLQAWTFNGDEDFARGVWQRADATALRLRQHRSSGGTPHHLIAVLFPLTHPLG